jgi:hypothetical protein
LDVAFVVDGTLFGQNMRAHKISLPEIFDFIKTLVAEGLRLSADSRFACFVYGDYRELHDGRERDYQGLTLESLPFTSDPSEVASFLANILQDQTSASDPSLTLDNCRALEWGLAAAFTEATDIKGKSWRWGEKQVAKHLILIVGHPPHPNGVERQTHQLLDTNYDLFAQKLSKPLSGNPYVDHWLNEIGFFYDHSNETWLAHLHLLYLEPRLSKPAKAYAEDVWETLTRYSMQDKLPLNAKKSPHSLKTLLHRLEASLKSPDRRSH